MNPVKIRCVESAFTKMFPEETFQFTGIGVDSSVSDQPMSDEETYLGAKNRAVAAKNASPNADYWVGIEGGIQEQDGMQAFAWIVVLDETQEGKAKTAVFYLPEEIRVLVKEGMELGHADDLVFKRSNSKQKDGAIGILTKGLIDRSEYYEPAVLMALIPFVNPDLY